MIIVTGGTGLLGGHLLWKLVQSGQAVRALLRPGGSPDKVLAVWKHLHPDPKGYLDQIEWVEADLTDPFAMEEIIEKGAILYHCAGKVSFSHKGLPELYRTNVTSTQTLIDVCLEKGVQKFMHISSIATLGEVDNGVLRDEGTPWTFRSKRGYSDSKIKAELQVWRGIAEGLNAVIINPSVIIGAGNWNQSSSRIFDFIYGGIKYYTPGITGFVDVMDVVDAMLILMNSEVNSERFILNSVNLPFKEFFRMVANSLGVALPKKQVNRHLLSFAAHLEKIRASITHTDPRLTSQAISSAFSKNKYSSEKFSKLNGFKYRSIEKSIERISKCYLTDKMGN